jgi:hypothetical protein
VRRAWLIGLLAIVACGDASVAMPPPVQAIVDAGQQTKWMTTGTDPWDVVVCHVPHDTRSLVYAGLPLRATLDPETLATLLNKMVGAYFFTLSNGAYRPQFTAGGEVTIGATDEPQACVDKALAATRDQSHGVLVIADAEHNANQPGGFGNPGSACAQPPCLASTTRRSAYIGAADFSKDWGDRPPMDLIEHEIGHALGWPHSGYDASLPVPERSALDVMSNSAAPRDVHADRRDAPGTLAINRLSAGWLPKSAVAVVPPSGGTVTLAPSSGRSGTRLAVVRFDDHRFLTVELLTADGFDNHLPASGIAVHLIEGSDATRTQTPLIGLPPYDQLLKPGQTFSGNGWRISVADGWVTTMQPINGAPTVST